MRVGLIFLSLVMTIICAQCQELKPDNPSTDDLEKDESRESETRKDLDLASAFQEKNRTGDTVMPSYSPSTVTTSWSPEEAIPFVTATTADAGPQIMPTSCKGQERNLPPESEDIATNTTAYNAQQEVASRAMTACPSDVDTQEIEQEGRTLEPTVETSEPPHRCTNYADPRSPCELDSTNNINFTDSLAHSLSKVSLGLFQNIMAKNRDVNVVFSPFSIAHLLYHLLLGSRGDTQKMLQDALFYPHNADCVHLAINKLGKSEGFVSASKIFYQQGILLNKFFVNDSKNFYDSTPQLLTQNADDNLELVNNWVAEKTHKKIKKLLNQVSSDVQLILLNAIYLRAKWITKFKTEKTRKEMFQQYGKNPVKVSMMNSEKYPLVSFSDSVLRARIGRLRLTDNMSLVIMLPQWPHQNLSKMEKQLNDDVFQQVMKRLYKDPIKPAVVAVPKFKVDTTLDLLDLLERMGLSELFYSPNLCGMATDTELAVSSGTHRSLVEVNEEGVEAAGASAISLARTYLTFEARHPFLFFLLNDNPLVPVFMGRIVNPNE